MRAKIILTALVLLALALSGLLLLGDRAQRSRDPDPPANAPVSSPASVPASPSPSPAVSLPPAAPSASPLPPATPPPASPPAVPRPPAPSTGVSGLTAWKGPDEAVATFQSRRCGREVLRFGAQQYTAGLSGVPNPGGIAYLGYSSGGRQLWGDRGAPSTLYITGDGGRTFTEWLAVSENC